MLLNTNQEFFPSSSKWINCKAQTFLPQSKKFGLRMLFAITIMMLHPEPSEKILLSFMDPNLAQITRTWIVTVILGGEPLIPPLDLLSHTPTPNSWTATSKPFSLLP